MQRIASESASVTTLVSWSVDAEGPLAAMLRTGGDLHRELLDWLRTEFGAAKPVVWTASLEVESQVALPEEMYEEDTILGDFLRAVREYEKEPSKPLNLEAFLAGASNDRALAAALKASDPELRAALLSQAAALGADLLRGEESA